MTLGLGERQGRSGWQGGGAGGKQPSLLLEASLLLDLVACRTRCLGFRRGVSVVLPVTGSVEDRARKGKTEIAIALCSGKKSWETEDAGINLPSPGHR